MPASCKTSPFSIFVRLFLFSAIYPLLAYSSFTLSAFSVLLWIMIFLSVKLLAVETARPWHITQRLSANLLKALKNQADMILTFTRIIHHDSTHRKSWVETIERCCSNEEQPEKRQEVGLGKKKWLQVLMKCSQHWITSITREDLLSSCNLFTNTLIFTVES